MSRTLKRFVINVPFMYVHLFGVSITTDIHQRPQWTMSYITLHLCLYGEEEDAKRLIRNRLGIKKIPPGIIVRKVFDFQCTADLSVMTKEGE
jgi:hypothetical protein